MVSGELTGDQLSKLTVPCELTERQHCSGAETGLATGARIRGRLIPRGIKMAYHTSPDKQIDDLCHQIQGEMDQHKLLQLIDQLDGLLDVKEKFLAKMVKEKKPSAPSKTA